MIHASKIFDAGTQYIKFNQFGVSEHDNSGGRRRFRCVCSVDDEKACGYFCEGFSPSRSILI